MDRRQWLARAARTVGASGGAAALGAAWVTPASAQLTESDAVAGVREALQRAAATAVAALGRPDGFLADPKVRIALPAGLKEAEKLLAATGQRARLDELVVGMNRAAEQAVPQAKALLTQAITAMSVEDGVRIVRGGDDAVTRYFSGKTRAPLIERFTPIVAGVVDRVALAQRYDALVQRAGPLARGGSVPTVQAHVTRGAVDGLFSRMADEERRLRADPAGAGGALLRRVFGAR